MIPDEAESYYYRDTAGADTSLDVGSVDSTSAKSSALAHPGSDPDPRGIASFKVSAHAGFFWPFY